MSYTYDQWRQISEAVGDAMQYAHDKALEHPDKADPLWNLDEYVNRIINVVFPSEGVQVDDPENEKLRQLVKDCIGVILSLCADADKLVCEHECPLSVGHEENECKATALMDMARELGIDTIGLI